MFELAAIGGALLGALLVIWLGKRKRGRDFLGLAFALFVGALFLWGFPIAHGLGVRIAADYPDARGAQVLLNVSVGGAMIVIFTALPVFLIGAVFVLAAKKAD